jgi:general secretion pathway protein B
MSIILEALRKSENERTRDPDARLAEVSRARVAPRSRTWFIVIALLLAINAGVLAWLVLKDDAPAPVAATPAPAPPPAAPVPVPRREVRDLAEVAGTASDAPIRTPDLPPAQHPLPAPMESADGALPTVRAPTAPAAPSLSQRVADAVAAEGGSRPAPPPVNTRPAAGGPDTSGMPTLDQLPPSAGVPALAVSLHYYDGPTGRSFITINGHMARAGTPLPEGPVVEAVTADGAILSYRGQRFLLPRN